jgi:hypothetical protein
MIVYGDPQYEEALGTLVARLRARVAALRQAPPHERSLDPLRALLIAAGQIEQGTLDAPPGTIPRPLARRLHAATGHAAGAFHAAWAAEQAGTGPAAVGPALARMARVLDAAALAPAVEIRITVKIPEGFAFYALYPEQYSAAAQRWLADHAAAKDRQAVVVGIRSIGTSLAAVVAATLAAQGWTVHSLSVRPTGHPFARRATVPPRQLRGAAWGLVVDEGPGLSGSSMAAVGAALERAGVPANRISFFPGHGGDPGSAAPEEVRARWAATPRYVVPPSAPRFGGAPLADALAAGLSTLCGGGDRVVRIEDFGGGLWRGTIYADPAQWPAVCAPFERPKYRVTTQSGRQMLVKYAGLTLAPGSADTSAEAEAALLTARAGRGWGPAPLGIRHGFLALPWIDGTPLTRADAGPQVLAHIGRYLAGVAGPPLSAAEGGAALARLREWLYWNTWEALGEVAAAHARHLSVRIAPDPASASYGDGHLAPHEWLRTPTGPLVKVDSTGHIHDHTIAGPQPVAWDVAGALVEWGLDGATAAPLLAAYATAGGVPIHPATLHVYRLAYAAYRLGQCHLCAQMSGDPAEAARLWTAAAFYRAALEQGMGEQR